MDPKPTRPVLQAGAIPFRRAGGKVEFCLVTSTRTGSWIFPKGMIDPGESAATTALKEAREEAGLRGRIVGDPVGSYEYPRRGGLLSVTLYLMEVTSSDEVWLESRLRRRCWVPREEARRRLASNDLRHLLDAAFQRSELRDPRP